MVLHDDAPALSVAEACAQPLGAWHGLLPGAHHGRAQVQRLLVLGDQAAPQPLTLPPSTGAGRTDAQGLMPGGVNRRALGLALLPGARHGPTHAQRFMPGPHLAGSQRLAPLPYAGTRHAQRLGFLPGCLQRLGQRDGRLPLRTQLGPRRAAHVGIPLRANVPAQASHAAGTRGAECHAGANVAAQACEATAPLDSDGRGRAPIVAPEHQGHGTARVRR